MKFCVLTNIQKSALKTVTVSDGFDFCRTFRESKFRYKASTKYSQLLFCPCKYRQFHIKMRVVLEKRREKRKKLKKIDRRES